MTFRLPAELRERAEAQARREGAKVSDVARKALEEYLARNRHASQSGYRVEPLSPATDAMRGRWSGIAQASPSTERTASTVLVFSKDSDRRSRASGTGRASA